MPAAAESYQPDPKAALQLSKIKGTKASDGDLAVTPAHDVVGFDDVVTPIDLEGGAVFGGVEGLSVALPSDFDGTSLSAMMWVKPSAVSGTRTLIVSSFILT